MTSYPATSQATDLQQRLLLWYDAHRRDLPWRALSGERADPYRVWLSEVMLQQTRVATVAEYFRKFMARWPTVAALAAADDHDVLAAWAGLGYYARARNLIACARQVAALGGFPDDEAGLRALPGVGAYSAAAIAAIAFDRPANVVDGNVERVIARLHAVEQPLPKAKPLLNALAAELAPRYRPGDHAQALMDLGSLVCTVKAPDCPACPWRRDCRAHAQGRAILYPRRLAKPARPHRVGVAFWAEAAGEILLIRRPVPGLLGGMLALPSSDWLVEGAPAALVAQAPFAADWRLLGPPVRHVFTHFSLDLHLAQAGFEARPNPVEGEWLARDKLHDAGLPSLFRKVVELGLSKSLIG